LFVLHFPFQIFLHFGAVYFAPSGLFCFGCLFCVPGRCPGLVSVTSVGVEKQKPRISFEGRMFFAQKWNSRKSNFKNRICRGQLFAKNERFWGESFVQFVPNGFFKKTPKGFNRLAWGNALGK